MKKKELKKQLLAAQIEIELLKQQKAECLINLGYAKIRIATIESNNELSDKIINEHRKDFRNAINLFYESERSFKKEKERANELEKHLNELKNNQTIKYHETQAA